MKPNIILTISIAAFLGCLLQIYALVRYLDRLPDDIVGITLYVITIIAFATASLGYFIQWRKVKKQQRQ